MLAGRAGRALAASFGVILLVAALWVATTGHSHDQSGRLTVYAAVWPAFTLEELSDSADAVVVIRPSAELDVHWNSKDRRAWVSDDQHRRAYIYSDQQVTVVRVIKGHVGDAPLTIRLFGGQVEGDRVEFEDTPSLTPGVEYLAFLDYRDTPTESGPEKSWTFLWQSNGLFTRSGDAWVNRDQGLSTVEDALREQ